MLVFLVYYPALSNGFVWDDHKAFQFYPFYVDIQYLWRAFTEPLIFSPDYYRPLTSSTFVLQNYFFGLHPAGLRFINLLLHAGNSTLIGLITYRLLDKWERPKLRNWVPLACATIYALHPALTESVAWISDRFDLLVAFFMLLALYLDLLIRHEIWRPVAIGAVFFLACLSKEMAFSIAAAFPFWHLAIHREKIRHPASLMRNFYRRGDLWVYLAIFLFGLVYLVLRYNALGHLVSAGGSYEALGNAWQRTLLVSRTYLEYGSLLFFPYFSLSPIHPIRLPVEPASLVNLVSLAMLVGIAALALYAIPKKPASAWFTIMLLVCLLPVANIIPLNRPAASFFSESYLVLPVSVFVLLLLALVVDLIKPVHFNDRSFINGFIVVIFVWAVLCVFIIRTTLPLWKDDPTLWSWAAIKAPQSTVAQNNLASTLLDLKRYTAARDAAHRAIELDPEAAMSWDTYGVALLGLGQKQEGKAALQKATRLDPGEPRHWYQLALVFMNEGKFKKAEVILKTKVLARDPNNTSALINLAITYRERGNKMQARIYFRKARALARDKQTIEFINSSIENLK
jgi:tetratricopeptide (TPR) repeat protein